MSSLYDINGIVPDSSEDSDNESDFGPSETEVFMSLRYSVNEVMNTPPRKVSSPTQSSCSSTGKKVKLSGTPEISDLNLTMACSPAYRHRLSIAREDMANIAFCLGENSPHEVSSTSQTPTRDYPLVPAIARLRDSLKSSDSSGKDQNTFFEISNYINLLKLSSPKAREKYSAPPLHSTPRSSQTFGSPEMLRCGNGRTTRNFIASPQAQK